MERMELDALTFDDRGLLPAIVQDAKNDEVLMMAWMTRESVERTLDDLDMLKDLNLARPERSACSWEGSIIISANRWRNRPSAMPADRCHLRRTAAQCGSCTARCSSRWESGSSCKQWDGRDEVKG